MIKKLNTLMKQKGVEFTAEQLENLLASLNLLCDFPDQLPFTDDDRKPDEEHQNN
jgi:hypothetical protein